MRKILSKIAGLALGLSLAVGVGVAASGQKSKVAHAAEQTVSWAATSGSLGSGIGSGTISTGSYEWTYTRTLVSGSSYTGYSSSCVQIGKNGGVENIEFTTSEIPGTIKSVYVESGSYNNAHKVSITVGGDTYLASTSTARWTTVTSLGGEGTSSGTIVISFTNGTRALYIKSITVTYEEGSGTPTLSAPTPAYDSANNVVTWNDVSNATGYEVSINDESSYVSATSPFDGNFVGGTQYTVYVKAIGDGENYLTSASKSVTFTAFTPDTFGLINSTSDLVAGETYIITSGYEGDVKAMSTESNTNNRRQTGVSVVSSKITSTQETLYLTLGGDSDDGWTFHTQNYLGTDGYLAPASGSGDNHLRVISTEDTCSISFNGSAAVITFSSNPGGRNILRYNTSGMFACYSTGQSDIYLWKKAASIDPSLKTMVIKESGTAADGGSYAYKTSGTYTFAAYEESTLLSNVAWSVSDTEIATINASSGALTTVKPGSVTVTAKLDGYNDATASIEITKGTVSSVVVSGNMSKTAYYVGESWSNAGLTATANYSTGWYEDVTTTATWTYSSASPALNVTQVTATAAFGGKSGSSSVQSVSVSKANPIQALYSLADQSTVTDIYGYFVGKIDNSNIVIMDGAWGIDLYSKDAYSSISYVENETILKVSGTISIYNGFYEILPTSVTVATSSEVETPIVYTAQGGETSNYCSRVTSVSGTPTVTSGDITSDCGVKDLTMSFDLGGGKSIPVFYHRNSQVAADYAKIQDAVNNSKSITVKGFTSWYQNAIQVKMNGIIDEVAGYTAEDFAQDLLDQTDAVCAGYKDGDNNHDAIEAIWSNLASNDKYPSLPSDQKTILAEAERNESGTVVEQAMARYDYLTGRYNLSNFINGRTPITTSGANYYTPATSSNSSTIIIVVVALTSITSIGVLLVIKRRRSLVK